MQGVGAQQFPSNFLFLTGVSQQEGDVCPECVSTAALAETL